MNETRIEAEEIKANAWQAYHNGEISREDALDIINRAKSYIMNANHQLLYGDYVRALSFLDAAKAEIEYLKKESETK
jgi:hypothetical protein